MFPGDIQFDITGNLRSTIRNSPRAIRFSSDKINSDRELNAPHKVIRLVRVVLVRVVLNSPQEVQVTM
ncbi:hypothetical protein Tco_0573301, partial [Tanacetum coccineum]